MKLNKSILAVFVAAVSLTAFVVYADVTDESTNSTTTPTTTAPVMNPQLAAYCQTMMGGQVAMMQNHAAMMGGQGAQPVMPPTHHYGMPHGQMPGWTNN